jgi:hypothetical protein
VPLHQVDTELSLETSYAPRQARLAYAEPCGSAPEMQFFSENAKSCQIVDVHGVSSHPIVATD